MHQDFSFFYLFNDGSPRRSKSFSSVRLPAASWALESHCSRNLPSKVTGRCRRRTINFDSIRGQVRRFPDGPKGLDHFGPPAQTVTFGPKRTSTLSELRPAGKKIIFIGVIQNTWPHDTCSEVAGKARAFLPQGPWITNPPGGDSGNDRDRPSTVTNRREARKRCERPGDRLARMLQSAQAVA